MRTPCLGLVPILKKDRGGNSTDADGSWGDHEDSVGLLSLCRPAPPSSPAILDADVARPFPGAGPETAGEAGCGSGTVTFGRADLLQSMWTACGCDDDAGNHMRNGHRQQDGHQRRVLTTRNKCRACTAISGWAAYALSRAMVRASHRRDGGTTVQFHGDHASVLLNGEETPPKSSFLPSDATDGSDEGRRRDGGWSHEVAVASGDVLSLKPRKGEGLLEFRIVVTAADSGRAEVGPPAPRDKEAGTVQDEEKTGASIGTAQEANTSSATNLLTADTMKDSVNGTPTIAAFFLPYGLASSRRAKLATNVQNLGATVVDDIFRANVVIINGTVRSLPMVAKSLQASEAAIRDHLRTEGVHCLLPSWADACTASQCLLHPGSRIHAWPYLPTVADPQPAATGGSGGGTCGNATRRRNARDVASSPADGAAQSGIGPRKRLRPTRYPLNEEVAEVFKTLSNLHQAMPLLDVDQWKSYCFRIVSGRLLNLDFEVATDPDTMRRLRSVKGFGAGVVDKIREYLETGTIRRIAEFQSDPQRIALKNLTGIWGVGRYTARELMNQGYRDVADVIQGLRRGKLALERNQLVGVECYDDILERMPRSEVEQIAQTVRDAAERMFPGIEVSIMGSYRRGKETCGDVDIHLVHPAYETEIPDDALGRIVDDLWTTGKIAFHLTFLNGMMTGSSYEDYEEASHHVTQMAWRATKRVPFATATSEHSTFYMGCFYSPVHREKRRRVDIKFYPYRERIFATVYFTGNGYFNRSMRLWATRRFNCKLNDHGLFDRSNEKKRMMEASSEKDLFDYLKLVYKEPDQRGNWDALEPMDAEGVDSTLEIQEMTESELRADEQNRWVE